MDIAIWSSVEQGLAITAGSLATLRPLLKSIGYRLGWSSKPTGYGTYNLSSTNNNFFAQRSNISRHEAHELSPVSRDTFGGEKPDPTAPAKTSEGFSVRLHREPKSRAQPRLTTVGKNDSEEELHSPRSWLKPSSEENRSV